MRDNLTIICLLFAILSLAGCAPATRPGEATKPSQPAFGEEIVAPSRAFVRLWQKPGAFDAIRFATVIGNTLYLAGTPRGLEAVDVDTGVPRWMHIGKLPLDYPPIEREGVLHAAEGGQVLTLDATTGLTRARSKTRPGLLTPLYPGDGYCVLGSGDRYVYAVSSSTGVKLWRSPLDAHPVNSTWDGEGLAYFLTAGGTLYGVSIPTKEITWRHTFFRTTCSPPTVAGKTIYVGSVDYYLYALDARSGSLEWKTSLSAPALDAPVVIGSRLYAATTENLIHAVDVNTHDELWTVPGEHVLTVTPQHVIFRGKSKSVNSIGIADAATGELLSQVTAGEYVLFAAAPEGGVVYAIGKKGDVLAIGDRAAVEAREAEKEAPKAAAEAAPKKESAKEPAAGEKPQP